MTRDDSPGESEATRQSEVPTTMMATPRDSSAVRAHKFRLSRKEVRGSIAAEKASKIGVVVPP